MLPVRSSRYVQRVRTSAPNEDAPAGHGVMDAVVAEAAALAGEGDTVLLAPAAASMDGPARLRLMHGALGRFFRLVLVAALVALGSGLWMIGRVAKETVRAGAGFDMPLSWTIMATLGIVMIAIFGHIR